MDKLFIGHDNKNVTLIFKTNVGKDGLIAKSYLFETTEAESGDESLDA